jgi:hypothetical protein
VCARPWRGARPARDDRTYRPAIDHRPPSQDRIAGRRRGAGQRCRAERREDRRTGQRRPIQTCSRGRCAVLAYMPPHPSRCGEEERTTSRERTSKTPGRSCQPARTHACHAQCARSLSLSPSSPGKRAPRPQAIHPFPMHSTETGAGRRRRSGFVYYVLLVVYIYSHPIGVRVCAPIDR